MQVKKVPGVGTPEDSCTVDGAVCRKNLAHEECSSKLTYFEDHSRQKEGSHTLSLDPSALTSLASSWCAGGGRPVGADKKDIAVLGSHVVLMEKNLAQQPELLTAC